jgi:putative heme-binding domain-containing protein
VQNAIAVALAGTKEGGEALLEAVTAGKASARLLQERLVQVRLDQSKPANHQERIARLSRGLPGVEQKFQELLQRRRTGFAAAKSDAARGAAVFEKHCAACHQLAGKGAKVGPQLDGIGSRGAERLLEDLIDPNRNVDQAFRASAFALSNGQLVTGLLLREEGETYVVADALGKEQRLSKGDVTGKNTTQLSPMPANLIEQVPEADFYDLLAYLLMQRAKP